MRTPLAVAVGLAASLASTALYGQAPVPTPGPEHQKLAIWVGDWTYEGEAQATPLGPAGRLAGKSTVRPILGGFFVEWQGEETGPSGTYQWRNIDGYDPVNRTFTWNGFGSDGGFQTGTYTITGTTVAYSGVVVAGGKPYHIKGTIVFATDLMSFVEKREVSVDGTWIPQFEVRSTKTKS